MFTPIHEMSTDEQSEVLAALDAPAEWESTWDVGLADLTDCFSTKPLSGTHAVRGRWPLAFPLGHHSDPRPWRRESAASAGYTCPLRCDLRAYRPQHLVHFPPEQREVEKSHRGTKRSAR